MEEAHLTYQLSKRIVDNLHEGVRVVDLASLRTTYWNKGAEMITGFSKADIIGRSCAESVPFHFNEEGVRICNPCPFLESVRKGASCERLVYAKHRKGELVPLQTCVEPVKDDRGNVIGAVEIFMDISWKFAALGRIEELNRLSLLDPLTLTGNRRFAEMVISAKLEELKRYGIAFGVLFIDIDDFKAVNDRFGHHHGDELLRMVSSSMMRGLRVFDSLCRWGGDEFIGIVTNIHHPDQMVNLCKRLCFLAERCVLNAGGGTAHPTISIGATIAKYNDSVEDLLSRADKFMYQSKLAGKNQFHIQ